MPHQRRPEDLFVGREAELSQLEEELRAASDGRGHMVLLAGEPGVGKSRLAQELCAHAGAHGFAVLDGRCCHETGTPPYWPWVQALRQLVAPLKPRELSALLGGTLSLVSLVLPEVGAGRRRSTRALYTLDAPDALRFNLLDALCGLLLRASARVPLLVFLDDLHWADEESLRLLVFVARQIDRSRLVVLGAYRDTETGGEHPLARALGELAGERAFAVRSLANLPGRAVAEFCARVFPPHMPPELSDRVFGITEGHPLFVRHIVRHLMDQGMGSACMAVASLPIGVRAVIRGRLDRLTVETVHVLEAASILGMEFGLKELRDLFPEPRPAQPATAVDEAREAHVLEEPMGEPGRFRFTHALIREVLVAGLPLDRRTDLHARAVDALETLYGAVAGPHAAEIAEHCAQAGSIVEPARLAAWSLRAGEHSLGSQAADAALALFRRGLAALKGQVLDDLQADLSDGASRALALLGSGLEALEHARRAFDHYRRSGNPARAVEVALGSWSITNGAEQLYDDAVALAPPGSTEEARLLVRGGHALTYTGSDESKGMKLLARSRSIAQRLGDKPMEIAVYNIESLKNWFHLHLSDFEANRRHMVELARELDDPHGETLARYMLAGWLGWEARVDEAREHIAAMYRAAHRSRLSWDLAIARWQDEHIARVTGEWEREREMRALILKPPGVGVFFPEEVLPIALEVECWTGCLGPAEGCVRQLMDLARVGSWMNNFVSTQAVAGAGRAAYLTGESWFLPEATELARKLLGSPLSPVLEGLTLAGVGFAAMAKGDAAAASDCRRRLTDANRIICDFHYPELLGALARRCGEIEEAAERLERAAELRKARRPSYAWICWELAEAMLERGAAGDRARAREMWHEALSTAEELGMEPLLRRLRERLGALGGADRPARPAGLTEREVEVLRLMAAGRTNKEIAFELGISPKTVQTYAGSIFAKIGAHNRAQAASFAVQHGLA